MAVLNPGNKLPRQLWKCVAVSLFSITGTIPLWCVFYKSIRCYTIVLFSSESVRHC